MKAKSQISRNRRQRPSLLDLWRRKKALRTKDLGPEDSDAEDGDAEKRFRMISQDVTIYSKRKADKIKEKIQDIDVCEVIANSPTVPFYVSLDLAPRSADANQEEGPSMSLFKHSQMYHAAVNLNNAPGRTEIALVHERRVRDAQSACERLHRSGGCVVCFARGFIDWRTHKLANCRRGVTTSKDQAWRVWRTDHLRVPSGACLSCCIPQNAVGGWHTYQTASFSIDRCPTPDIVKPIAYTLMADDELFKCFSETSLFDAFRSSHEDYASWLLKKQHPAGLPNILETVLWLVNIRFAQNGFSTD